MHTIRNPKVKPFFIVGVFWLALFLFVLAGYSGTFGPTAITGYAVKEDTGPGISVVGIQSIAILILFFTNIVTIFFFVREIAKK